MPARLALFLLVALAWPASATAAPTGPPGDFGDVVVGNEGPVIYLPVTSSGTRPIAVSGASIDDTNFALALNGCTTPITAPAVCFVGVQFRPQSTGVHTATLTLEDPSGNGTIALTGNGVPAPASGGQGATGPQGPAGAPGASGPTGPQGIPGRAIQATCTTKGKPRKTTCRIVVLPDDVAAVAVRVRLIRGGKTVARGRAAREGRVKLRSRKRLRAGRYTLAVSFDVDGRTVRARQPVRLR